LAAESVLSAGEPGQGIDGWRLSHRQAKAALPIALRGREDFIRYGDVALIASLLRDDLLATSLRELYLKPLAKERDRGKVCGETLRAYFASGRNVSSAAAVLGVNRNTITNRLRTVEEAIGRPLSSCETEIESALQLQDLDDSRI
jgi:DNA-binding PucR family transcriptional regulator